MAKINPPPIKTEFVTQPLEQKEVIEIEPVAVEQEIIASGSLENEKYALDLSDVGGSIQKIQIKDGKRFDIDLVEKAFYRAGVLSIEGKGALQGLSSQQFAIKRDTNSLYTEKNGLAIEKQVRFLKNQYGLNAYIKITNNSGVTQNLSFELTTASNISDKEAWESRYIGVDVLYKDGKIARIAKPNSKNHNTLYQNNIEWLALRNKYYSIIAQPDFIPSGVFTDNIQGSPVAGFIVDERIVPGETKTYKLLFYMGPTEGIELE